MKILLVRLRMIGDVVFTTPAVTALRDRFPAAHITYIVEPAAAPVVRGNPFINEVVVAPRQSGLGGFLADVRLGRQLARQGFNIAIDFHGGPRASLLTWLSGAPRRIGYEIAGRGWMYTERVHRPRALRARHSVENQWDLLASVGVAAPSRSRFPLNMAVDGGVQRQVRERLALHHVPGDARMVVMHVSASNPFRRWPVPAFSEVAAQLAARHPRVHVLVTSGPSESDAAARVIEGARLQLSDEARPRVVDSGDFSLAELRALVEDAALYIGGDSGPMHIAATSRVPMVSLYGPTLPARSEPWRDPSVPHLSIETLGLPCRPCGQRVCEPGDFRCLSRITPAQVVAAAEQLLRRNS